MERGYRSCVSGQGVTLIPGHLPTFPPQTSRLQDSGTNGKKQPQELPPAPEGEAGGTAPHLILALYHPGYTSISYSQDVGEEVVERTEAQTGQKTQPHSQLLVLRPPAVASMGHRDISGAEAHLALPAHISAVCDSATCSP